MLVAARRSLSLAAARTRAASTYNTEKTTFLLNWYANPYHTPIYVAKEQGWLKEEGIDLAILEATDPSDVTEIVGDGAIGLGLKAMIHILAAKDKGIDLKSFGTLLDEPPTGLIHKKSANINKFSDIQGKKVPASCSPTATLSSTSSTATATASCTVLNFFVSSFSLSGWLHRPLRQGDDR